MINKVSVATLCAALIVSPIMVSAGGPGEGGVSDQIVERPQDDEAAPVVGSLNSGLIAGGVLAALLLAAAGSSSTSSTPTTNN